MSYSGCRINTANYEQSPGNIMGHIDYQQNDCDAHKHQTENDGK